MERKVNLKEVRDQFYQYALSEHEEDIKTTLEDGCDPTRHIPVYVNFLTLSESCSVLTDLLRTSGSQVLPALDLALTRAARHLYGRLADAGATGLTLKTRLHARLIELPVCAELQRACVPRIEDEGRLLCVSGTVVRAGLPHLLDTRAHYTCNKCKHQFIVWAEYEQSYQTERPVRCPNPLPCRAGAGFSVGAAPDAGLKDHQARDYQEIRLQEQVQYDHQARDYQEIRLQEQVQKLDVGKIPRGLCVVLEDDLVDSCKAGDDVIVTGTVRQRWRSVVRGCPPDIELTLHANRVFVNSEQRTSLLLTDQRLAQFTDFWRRYRHDPLAGRNRILQRFCSQIYGMYVVKLAVALTLVGGVRRGDGTTSTRGEPHLLLIGDPGTGKSQLLKYAARLCARSVLTTGIGSTSAGLTCTAVKEGPEWQLEAGALVLADGGVCCIDEFNSVREADKTSIHEAMEQQTISVAKAGMVCKLNTRCSILAAANPRLPVDWDSGDDVLSKLGLGSPLLSRFDLILVLKDARSHGWDRLVSGYILSGLDPLSGCQSQSGEQTEAADWSLETLQAYLAHVRTLQPQPDREAVTVLQTYYQLLRGRQSAGRSRTTVRLLESLLRLTQAHARLRCSPDGARLCDAVVAVTLMEASLGGLGGGLLGADGVGSILHTGFPDSPADEYRAQCELILGRLGLDELLAAELASLDRRRWLETTEGASEPGPAAADGGASPAGAGGTAGSAESGDTDRHADHLSTQPPLTATSRPRQPARHEPNRRPDGPEAVEAGFSSGESPPGWTPCRPGDEDTAAGSAAADPPHGPAAGAGHRSRFAGLRARAAAAAAAPSTNAEPADSLTGIRPAPDRTAGRSAPDRTSNSPPEPPAEHRPPVLQLDRFKFVRPKPAAAKRPAGWDRSLTAGAGRGAAAGEDSSPAARTRTCSSALDMDNMDDDFESLLSGRSRGGGGGRGGDRGGGVRGARRSRPGRTRAGSDRTPADPPSDVGAVTERFEAAERGDGSCSSGGGEAAPSPAPSRRTLSAATLGKLARFSADPDLGCDSAPAPATVRRPEDGCSVRPADRSTLPVSSQPRPAAPAAPPDSGQSQFESADDALGDLDLDFSWPPSKRPRASQASRCSADGSIVNEES